LGVFSYKNTYKKKASNNLGDTIQTFAAIGQIAPGLKGCNVVFENARLRDMFLLVSPSLAQAGRGRTVYIWEVERDNTHLLARKVGPGVKVHVLANGWYMHPDRKNGHISWPFADVVVPLFVSMHLACPKKMLTPAGVAYLKKWEPIGCRDMATTKNMQSHGIDAYFSACMTLLTCDVVPPCAPSEKRNEVFVVDCPVPGNLKKIPVILDLAGRSRPAKQAANNPRIISVKHTMNIQSPTAHNAVYDLLVRYSMAKQVVTSRLHCALPCVSMGTRASFVDKKGHATEEWKARGRFSGLYPITTHPGLALRYQQNLRATISTWLSGILHPDRAIAATVLTIHEDGRATLALNQDTVDVEASSEEEEEKEIVLPEGWTRQNVLTRLPAGSTDVDEILLNRTWLRAHPDATRAFIAASTPKVVTVFPISTRFMTDDNQRCARAMVGMHGNGNRQRQMMTKTSTKIDASAPQRTATAPAAPSPRRGTGNPKNVYTVAFTSDQNFLQYIPTVLFTLQHAHRKEPSVKFKAYIVLRGVKKSDQVIRSMITHLARRVPTVQPIFIENPAVYTYKNSLKHVTMSCLDRLVLPELLPAHENRIVYLDLDIMVISSILPLFKVKVGPKGISGKPSFKQNVVANWLKKNKDSGVTYRHRTSINAGVLVMDLDVLREKKFTEFTLDLCQKHLMNDQSAINIYIDGQNVPIDARFNAYYNQDLSKTKHAAIIHFAGSKKVWDKGFPNRNLSMVWNRFEKAAARP
jgi:lipopolysaccharide biosynthesis glycosyltransferase